MNPIQFVWFNEDLRREIFSYLRKEAKVKCDQCNDVCVWDKKVKEHIQVYPFLHSDEKYYCTECLGEYYSSINMGCTIN